MLKTLTQIDALIQKYIFDKELINIEGKDKTRLDKKKNLILGWSKILKH